MGFRNEMLLAAEPYTEVGSGGSAPAFQNSWVNYGAGYQTAAFYKDLFGVVHFKGLVKSGTVGAAIFTLPSGYRPIAETIFVANAAGAFGDLRVSAVGNVWLNAGTNGYLSIDGISFRAQQ
jgi:hypothetical protein